MLLLLLLLVVVVVVAAVAVVAATAVVVVLKYELLCYICWYNLRILHCCYVCNYCHI